MNGIQGYLDSVAATILRLQPDRIQKLLSALVQAYNSDRAVFVFGNGGSAATASHFACDLNKGTISSHARRFRAAALTDNVPVVTAWANDAEYGRVFAEQIQNLGRPGDVAFAISGSGNSSNVLLGVEQARRQGMVTLCVTGYQGGKLHALVDESVIVASDDLLQIEDAHLVICHVLTACVRDYLAAQI